MFCKISPTECIRERIFLLCVCVLAHTLVCPEPAPNKERTFCIACYVWLCVTPTTQYSGCALSRAGGAFSQTQTHKQLSEFTQNEIALFIVVCVCEMPPPPPTEDTGQEVGSAQTRAAEHTHKRTERATRWWTPPPPWPGQTHEHEHTQTHARACDAVVPHPEIGKFAGINKSASSSQGNVSWMGWRGSVDRDGRGTMTMDREKGKWGYV